MIFERTSPFHDFSNSCCGPKLLDELGSREGTLIRRLGVAEPLAYGGKKLILDEKAFRWMLNEDAMATEKLAEGIRNFTKDTLKLEEFACRACISH